MTVDDAVKKAVLLAWDVLQANERLLEADVRAGVLDADAGAEAIAALAAAHAETITLIAHLVRADFDQMVGDRRDPVVS